MRRYRQIVLGCMAALLLAGCGGRKEEIYQQAGKDLEQANYEYALQGYQDSITNDVHLAQSYRGAGVANLELGNYAEAVTFFEKALGEEKLSDSARKDILQYRITAYYKAGQYENAMADCQTLAEYGLDEQGYFLTGKTALAMDVYDEAALNFNNAYTEEATYDMAIQIYQAYLEKGMEADGTQFLEKALENAPSNAQDYCDRGRIYFYMEDYGNAQKELLEAVNKENSQAVLLLGKTYLAQNDVPNARAMYQQYIDMDENAAKGYNGLALCDMAEGMYDAALANIEKGLESAQTEDMQNLMFNQVAAYEKKLDFAAAYDKVQEYLQMFPEDQEAEKERIFLAGRIQSAQAPVQAQNQETGEFHEDI